jgi:carboxylesterase
VREPRVVAGAEEFAVGDGPTGALLVHGFTGSPQGLRGLGEYLAEHGIAVTGIRLPGHGTSWQDLNTKTSEDWIEAVRHGFERAAEGRDKIFIVALSFGAALALDFASRNPARVAGLVTLGGFVHTKDLRRFLAPVVKRLAASMPGVGNDIADPVGVEICYDRFPTRAGHSMLIFLQRLRRRLGDVHCPLLIMHGRNDHTVHPGNAKLIYDSVSSDDKEIVWCERSYHVITLDFDRFTVYERTYEFIKERATNGN